MPNDGGVVSVLEDWIVAQLAAATHNGESVFAAVEEWKHQLLSGADSFSRFEPFAFVKYQPVKANREGDYDLRQVLRFAIAIGVESKQAGVARRGDTNNLGTSKIRDIVIDTLDGGHPGGAIACDPLYYVGELEIVDTATRHGIEMYFEADMITD